MSDAGRDRASERVAAATPGEAADRARSAATAALEKCTDVLAVWEGGSAGFGRADELSDVDICVIAADGSATRVLDAVEEAARLLAGDLVTWTPPVAPFGEQRLIQPADASQLSWCALLDVSVAQHRAEESIWRELLQPERHGRALVLHDPHGLLARELQDRPEFDCAGHRARLQDALDSITARRTLFGGFGAKELRRGRRLDAHWIHQSMVISPLVTLVNMRHRPLRFDFALRYAHDELPEAVVRRLVSIVDAAGADELEVAMNDGLAWIDELLRDADPAQLPIEDHSAQMRAAFG